MGRILEGILIALRAIWSSKLRSFMSVLGNIVAVTSIIAVVSLIQGLNATVTDAIVSEVGRRFLRRGSVRRDAERRGLREGPQQPADHPAGCRGDPEVQPARALGDGREQPDGAGRLPGEAARERQRPGRVGGVRELLLLQRRARPPAQPERSRAPPQRRAAGLGHRRPAVRPGEPARQDHQDRGDPLPRHRRQREEGRDLRPVAGRVRGDSARRVPEALRRAREHHAQREARQPGRRGRGHEGRHRGPADRAPAQAEAEGQLRHVHVGLDPGDLPRRHQRASSPCWSGSWPCRCWWAAS